MLYYFYLFFIFIVQHSNQAQNVGNRLSFPKMVTVYLYVSGFDQNPTISDTRFQDAAKEEEVFGLELID